MMLRRKSFVILLILLAALFVPPVIEQFFDLSPSPTLIQSIGFAITLFGLFIGAYFELERLDKSREEERQREKRQQKLEMLKSIEEWVDGVAQAIEDIGAIRELGPRDEKDNKLLVNREIINSVAERLYRLDNQWFTIVTKTAETIGLVKGKTEFDDLREEYRALLMNIARIGMAITGTWETLSKSDTVPGIDYYDQLLAETKQAIDRIRLSME